MQPTRTKAPRFEQLTFERRGGARRGAGRKPNGERALVSRSARPPLASRFPVLVTLRLERGLPSLRRSTPLEVLHDAFRAGRERRGMRLIHFSIQSNHIHLLVEACDTPALSRGMQGLSVRIARALNRSWARHGRVFADRFHSRILRTPREVRYALAYVLNNARKHNVRVEGLDPFASGSAFDGWTSEAVNSRAAAARVVLPVVSAGTWLLRVGWRRHGRIRIGEVPGAHVARSARGHARARLPTKRMHG